MYQSTSSIALSEIRPTAWLARCIVTYASITRPEMSRSRRIIEQPDEGGAGSRNVFSPAPRLFYRAHLDKPLGRATKRWGLSLTPPGKRHSSHVETGG